MIRDGLLAVGVVMSAAAQLRIPGSPFGPGELCLGLWLALSGLDVALRGRAAATSSFCVIGAFWIALAVALGIGALTGLVIDDPWDRGDMTHDAMAYSLAACMSCLAVAQTDEYARLRRSTWCLIVLGNASLAVQILAGFGLISIPGVNPWYWDRFRGWSENPNQLALYCAAFGPLSLHLASTSQRWTGRVLGGLGVILPIVAGRLSRSDTFLLATLAMLSVLIALRLITWLRAPHRRLRFAAAILLIIGLPPIAFSMLPFGMAMADDAEMFALSLAKDKGGEATVQTANLRFFLWDQATRRGLQSLSLGLGPGPHLERPPVTNEQSLPRPFEAHSTFLDLFTQGGALAVLALLALFTSVIVFTGRGGLDALAALAISLLVFGVTHFILRHPITWFVISLCLVASLERAPEAPTERGR